MYLATMRAPVWVTMPPSDDYARLLAAIALDRIRNWNVMEIDEMMWENFLDDFDLDAAEGEEYAAEIVRAVRAGLEEDYRSIAPVSQVINSSFSSAIVKTAPEVGTYLLDNGTAPDILLWVTGGLGFAEPPTDAYEPINRLGALGLFDSIITNEEVAQSRPTV